MYNNTKEDDKMYNIPTTVNTKVTPHNKSKIFIIFFITIVLFIIFALFLLNVKILNTHGHSMQPTIKDNSYVICVKSDSIERGDIIAFKRRGEIKIKRVVGLSNEIININKEGRVYIGSELLKENYVSNFTQGDIEIPIPHTVSSNSVFVLGDNRENSLDSRHHQIGDIKINEIICEVKLVI